MYKLKLILLLSMLFLVTLAESRELSSLNTHWPNYVNVAHS